MIVSKGAGGSDTREQATEGNLEESEPAVEEPVKAPSSRCGLLMKVCSCVRNGTRSDSTDNSLPREEIVSPVRKGRIPEGGIVDAVRGYFVSRVSLHWRVPRVEADGLHWGAQRVWGGQREQSAVVLRLFLG